MTANVKNTNHGKVFTHTCAGIELRTLLDEQGNPWFLAKDVCVGLGLRGDISSNCSKLCDFERMNPKQIGIDFKQRGGKQPLIVSESGFYKLVMRSDKPEAATFQRWVCEEVLPEIRKTGSYEAGSDAPAVIKDMADALNPLDCTFLEAKEYCQVREIPEEAKSILGKIATRLCYEQDKPKRWTNIDKKIIKKFKLKFKSVGQYPVTILDQAYELYQQDIRE